MVELRAPSMALSAFLSLAGYAEAAWRLPGTDPLCHTDIRYFLDLARTAERGGFDALFIADSVELWGDVGRRPTGTFEPSILAAVLLAATDHVGVIITLSTTFNEPYNVARRLASLDHLSSGRVGWNIVTSASDAAAANFGLDRMPQHQERYARATEFVDVCRQLWNSWDEGAVRGDKDGAWGDRAKVRRIDHVGRFFRVAGPLDTPRSPQVVPLLVQAGSSSHGIELAAGHADAVFTVQSELPDARRFRDQVRRRAVELGRVAPPAVLPGLVPVLADTAAEARALADELEAGIDVDAAISAFEQQMGFPGGSLDADAPLEHLIVRVDDYTGNRTLYDVVARLAGQGASTVGDVVRKMNGDRGHLTVVGTADDVASTMIRWFDRGAADGFNIIFPVLPRALDAFVDDVVPRLERAGRRQCGRSRTMHERFGASGHLVERST